MIVKPMTPRMSRPRRTLSLRLGLIAVVAVAAALGATTLRVHNRAVPGGTTAVAPTSDKAAVGDVVRRFIDAIRAGDADTLYELQSASYKSVCSRQDFERVVTSFKGERLDGPVGVTVQGDVAGASVTEKLPDGSIARNIIPLTREVDGGWKLAPPSSTGCTP